METLEKQFLNEIKTDKMKEYKIIKKNFWKKDDVFENLLNQLSREGWSVNCVTHTEGHFSKALLERDKNR